MRICNPSFVPPKIPPTWAGGDKPVGVPSVAPQEGDRQAGVRLDWPGAGKSIAALPEEGAGLGKGFCCRREGICCAVPGSRGASEPPLFKGRR